MQDDKSMKMSDKMSDNKSSDQKLTEFRATTNKKLSVLETQLSEMAASIRTLKAVVTA